MWNFCTGFGYHMNKVGFRRCWWDLFVCFSGVGVTFLAIFVVWSTVECVFEKQDGDGVEYLGGLHLLQRGAFICPSSTVNPGGDPIPSEKRK